MLNFVQYIKSIIAGDSGLEVINILKEFQMYQPYSSGSYKSRSSLAKNSINSIFNCLVDFSLDLNLKTPTYLDSNDRNIFSDVDSKPLKDLFNKFGSDKSSAHNYHLIYHSIISSVDNCSCIAEIGLGTNNSKIVSNMNGVGIPGASLRAFSSYLPHANIFGADIDESILFSFDNIKTCYINQLDKNSFINFFNLVSGKSVDLFIDDGLHSPDANLNTLSLGLKLLSDSGAVVIEDIGLPAFPFWNFIGQILSSKYHTYIVRDGGMLMFVVSPKEKFKLIAKNG
jgi:hypothetical protein